MYPFVETLRISDGCIERMALHTERMNRTRRVFYPDAPLLDLADVLVPPVSGDVLKGRVTYGAIFGEITNTPYRIRPENCLRLVVDDAMDYTNKRTDRSVLEAAFACRDGADDVLIVRRGLLTDTSIGNVALLRDGAWLTPRSPLLAGTRRAALLAEGVITEADVWQIELSSFQKLRVFNAMIPWGAIEISVTNLL